MSLPAFQLNKKEETMVHGRLTITVISSEGDTCKTLALKYQK